jgi:hypothetical protein
MDPNTALAGCDYDEIEPGRFLLTATTSGGYSSRPRSRVANWAVALCGGCSSNPRQSSRSPGQGAYTRIRKRR